MNRKIHTQANKHHQENNRDGVVLTDRDHGKSGRPDQSDNHGEIDRCDNPHGANAPRQHEDQNNQSQGTRKLGAVQCAHNLLVFQWHLTCQANGYIVAIRV